MAKIKLTKNEFKKQKDALKMFTRYLPTLQLKKQQLQMEIRTVELRAAEVRKQLEAFRSDVSQWVALFCEEVGIADIVAVKELITSRGNIAGVDIPVFDKVEFSVKDYNLFVTPLWLDRGIDAVKKSISLELEHRILEEQKELLQKELRTTTQRVNLFEKVKIPETKSNIKQIAIYLGDQQTAAVVRGKISKRNLERKSRMVS